MIKNIDFKIWNSLFPNKSIFDFRDSISCLDRIAVIQRKSSRIFISEKIKDSIIRMFNHYRVGF